MNMRFGLILAAAAALTLAGCEEPASPETAADATLDAGAGLDPATVEFFQQSVGDRVFFETDSSALGGLARQTLNRQAQWLNQNPDVSVTVEGHADERGTREYNLALGARRAEAARAYLVSQGVAASRLRTISFGKERPEALCSAETCWSQNRRSVSVLAGAPTS